MIYFIECQTTKHVKIGRSDQVRKRFRTLQSACPTELKLVVYHYAPNFVEKWLHTEFSADRVQGEWFKPSKRLWELAKDSNFIQNLTTETPTSTTGKPIEHRQESGMRLPDIDLESFGDEQFKEFADIMETFGQKRRKSKATPPLPDINNTEEREAYLNSLYEKARLDEIIFYNNEVYELNQLMAQMNKALKNAKDIVPKTESEYNALIDARDACLQNIREYMHTILEKVETLES